MILKKKNLMFETFKMYCKVKWIKRDATTIKLKECILMSKTYVVVEIGVLQNTLLKLFADLPLKRVH